MKDIQQVMAYITIPFVLAIPPILGWFIGQWIDKKIGTEPYFMYFLIILGLIAGFRELYKIIQRFGDDS